MLQLKVNFVFRGWIALFYVYLAKEDFSSPTGLQEKI